MLLFSRKGITPAAVKDLMWFSSPRARDPITAITKNQQIKPIESIVVTFYFWMWYLPSNLRSSPPIGSSSNWINLGVIPCWMIIFLALFEPIIMFLMYLWKNNCWIITFLSWNTNIKIFTWQHLGILHCLRRKGCQRTSYSSQRPKNDQIIDKNNQNGKMSQILYHDWMN